MKKTYGIKKRLSGIAAAALVLALTLALLAGCGGGSSGSESKGTLKIYALGDYIDPDLIYQFEDEYGWDVIMDTFDTNEEMYPVIKNGSVDYDLICVSDYMIEKLASEGLLGEYDASRIPNLEYIMDIVKPFWNDFDPGEKHSVPHTWGTYGILYNPDLIAELGIDESELSSWQVLWDRRAEGQIIMPNSIREAYMITAELLDLSINTVDPTELEAMTRLLSEQKDLVYRYDNDGARDYLINESAALAVVTSGEVLYSQEYNDKLEYIVPDEGTEVWTDCWAVTAAADEQGVEAASDWINFMLSKEAAELNFEYLTYAIPNSQIAELLDNPVLTPSEELLSRCETLRDIGPEAEAMYSEYWKRVKGN